MNSLQILLVYGVGAFLYSVASWWSKNAGAGDVEWEWQKFVRAMVVGLIVGVYAAGTKTVVNATNYATILTASGATVLSDQIVKGIWRYYKQWRESQAS